MRDVSDLRFSKWMGRFCLKRFVPLPAVSLASSLNVICMRWNELRTGIEVYEKGGNVVGVSKTAAKQVRNMARKQEDLISTIVDC